MLQYLGSHLPIKLAWNVEELWCSQDVLQQNKYRQIFGTLQRQVTFLKQQTEQFVSTKKAQSKDRKAFRISKERLYILDSLYIIDIDMYDT